MSELAMQVMVTHEPQALRLEYRVTNPTGTDAYLLNQVPDVSLRTRPDVCYVTLDRERRLVRVAKNIPTIPPGVAPPMPIAPYVTALRAGAAFTESIRLSVPVREVEAYRPSRTGGALEHFAGLTFTLAYYLAIPGMTEKRMDIIPGVSILVPTSPPRQQVQVRELDSGVIALAQAVAVQLPG